MRMIDGPGAGKLKTVIQLGRVRIVRREVD
jgi:hypothetical protein